MASASTSISTVEAGGPSALGGVRSARASRPMPQFQDRSGDRRLALGATDPGHPYVRRLPRSTCRSFEEDIAAVVLDGDFGLLRGAAGNKRCTGPIGLGGRVVGVVGEARSQPGVIRGREAVQSGPSFDQLGAYCARDRQIPGRWSGGCRRRTACKGDRAHNGRRQDSSQCHHTSSPLVCFDAPTTVACGITIRSLLDPPGRPAGRRSFLVIRVGDGPGESQSGVSLAGSGPGAGCAGVSRGGLRSPRRRARPSTIDSPGRGSQVPATPVRTGPGFVRSEEHTSCQHLIPMPQSARRVISQC